MCFILPGKGDGKKASKTALTNDYTRLGNESEMASNMM